MKHDSHFTFTESDCIHIFHYCVVHDMVWCERCGFDWGNEDHDLVLNEPPWWKEKEAEVMILGDVSTAD